MTSPTPLHGIELLDCAQANAKLGLPIATKQCGYGNDIRAFINELQKAGSDIGLHISSLNDLLLEGKTMERERDFSPESPGRI